MNRNTSRFAIALVVLVAGLGLGLAGVAAQDASTTLVDEPIDPTNETESIYVDATGVDDYNGSDPVNVTVTVEGLDENESAGNGTELDSATLTVDEGNTESYDYTLADEDRDYDELHLTAEVESEGDEELIDSTDWGTLEEVSGGGGGGLGGVETSTGLIVAVIVIGGAWLIKKED